MRATKRRASCKIQGKAETSEAEVKNEEEEEEVEVRSSEEELRRRADEREYERRRKVKVGYSPNTPVEEEGETRKLVRRNNSTVS